MTGSWVRSLARNWRRHITDRLRGMKVDPPVGPVRVVVLPTGRSVGFALTPPSHLFPRLFRHGSRRLEEDALWPPGEHVEE